MKSGKAIFIFIFMTIAIFVITQPRLYAGGIQQTDAKDSGYADPEKTIPGNVGEVFSIILDSNPSTGYQWRLAYSSNGKLLKLVNTEYKGPETELIGRGGHEIWSFKALSVGQGVVVFEYARPWETNKAPVKSMTFTIDVRQTDSEGLRR